jgi:protein TonB
MGLVFGLHAAVLGAIILTPPETIKRIIYDPLDTYNVRMPPPPPMPAPEPREDTPSNVPKVDTIVPTPRTDFPEIRLVDRTPDLPPLPPQPEIMAEPKPAPVTIEAKPDPRFAAALQPPYPSAMARQEIEGRVVIRVLIGIDGRVKAVEPVSATDPAFQEATAAQALKRWRFKPASRDGVPIESWRTMTVRFELAA